jgi:uncharacterized membrane protein
MIAGLWLVFGGTHVGLAVLREGFVARIGTLPYTVAFYGLAAATFGALTVYYADHRGEGPAGLGLVAVPAARRALEVCAGAGIVLLVAGLAAYPRLPTALFLQPMREPRGIELVTRHPTFAGIAMWSLAHVLLATRLAGAVWFGGFVVLSVVGAWHQDRRALATRGGEYAAYLRATSFVPFARRMPPAREVPWAAVALGLAAALVLRRAHAHLLDAHGLWTAAAVIGGGGLAGAQALRRARRARPGREVDPAPAGAAAREGPPR